MTLRQALLVVAGAVGFGRWIGGMPSTDWLVFAVGVTVLVAATLGVVHREIRSSRDAFSPLALAGVFYLTAFAAGSLYAWAGVSLSQGDSRLFLLYDQQGLIPTIWLATGAWLLFVFGYQSQVLRGLVVPAGLRLRYPQRPSVLALVLLYGLGWFARALALASGKYSNYDLENVSFTATSSAWLLSALALLPLLVAAYLVALRLMSVSGSVGIIGPLMFLSEIAWALPTGRRRQLVAVLLAGLVVLYYARPSALSYRRVAAVIGVIVLVVFPFGQLIRSDEVSKGKGPWEATIEAASQLGSQGPSEFVGTGLSATVSRLSEAASLTILLEKGSAPVTLPRWSTLQWVPEAFVPRAVMPSKADPGRFGNSYSRAYGLSDPGNTRTSVTVTHPGELYLNFGLLGVVVGMPLVGLLYRVVSTALQSRRGDPGVLALYAVASWPLLESHENVIALGLVGTIKVLLVLGLLFWVASAFRLWTGMPGRAPSRAPIRLSAARRPAVREDG